MLTRIHVKQLRLGMFVHELCGSWMDHPFWRGAFLLDKPHDLQTILSTNIKEVWIDDSKGLGVEGGKDEQAIAAEVETTLDRKSVAEGKRVERGGRRILKKQKEAKDGIRDGTVTGVQTCALPI